MGDFRTSMLALRAQMNSQIEELGTRYIRDNKISFLSQFKYQGKILEEYFISTSVEEKGIIIEVLLDAPFKELMERIVTKLINSSQIEKRAQLMEMFSGIEPLLTKSIEINIVIKSKLERSKESAKGSIQVTVFGFIISILTMVWYNYSKDNMLLYVSLLATVLTAGSSLALALAMWSYKSILKSNKELLS